MLCCLVLLLVRYLGFITEGNTYRRCAASSLPLWGNTDVASSRIRRNFWRPCRGDIINIYQVPNHKYHLLAIYIICHFPLVFLSPTSQKFAILFALFFVHRFLVRSIFLLAIMSDFGMAETDDGLTPKIGRSGNLDAKTFVLG